MVTVLPPKYADGYAPVLGDGVVGYDDSIRSLRGPTEKMKEKFAEGRKIVRSKRKIVRSNWKKYKQGAHGA